jgi:hypothetical protein
MNLRPPLETARADAPQIFSVLLAAHSIRVRTDAPLDFGMRVGGG